MWAKRLKDKHFRSSFRSKEERNIPIHFLLRHNKLEQSLKLFIAKRFLRTNKRSFSSQFKNRCILTFRSRSTLRLFRLSRILFRSSASSGFLLGVKKSSW